MNSLEHINKLISAIDYEEEWNKRALGFKVVMFKITDDGFDVESLTGNGDKGMALNGVYRWDILGFSLYIGLAAGRTTPVPKRQASHFSSFKNAKLKNEMTGKKVRKFMLENNLTEMIVTITFIPFNNMMQNIKWFESGSIQALQPIFNDECQIYE